MKISACIRFASYFFSALVCLGALSAKAIGHREINGYVQSYRYFVVPPPSFPVQSKVQVFDRDAVLISEVITDESGAFSVTGLKPGDYTLGIQALNPRDRYGRFRPLTATVSLHRHDETVWRFVLQFIPD